MRKILILILCVLMMTGCQEKFLVSQKPVEDKRESAGVEHGTKAQDSGKATSIERLIDTKPVVYEEPVGEGALAESVKHPIINIKSEYATSVNELINAKVSEYITKNSENKDDNNVNPVLEYEVYENDGFFSLFIKTSDNKETGKYFYSCYNINKSTGNPVTINELDKNYGFTGNLQALIEDEIVFHILNEESQEGIQNLGKTMESFWSMQYKGYPQVYVKDSEVKAIYEVFSDNDERVEKIISINPTKGGANAQVNQIYLESRFKEEYDFALAKLGDVSDKETAKEALKKAGKFLTNVGYEKTPTLLKSDKIEEDKLELYLLIPKYLKTVVKTQAIEKATGVPIEDLSKIGNYRMDNAYIAVLPSEENKLSAKLEIVFRRNRFIVDKATVQLNGKDKGLNYSVFDFTSALEAGEKEAYEELVKKITK